ncbi:hypothetical protein [Bordetella pertussis]|uniref:hypothetical protein n=1 Tax=Bordetella pertussis TaxID=520 RepID=UPI0005E3123D|nr:hypothetical protein [Bordetella pertussis]CPP62555.1 Uncharacterised protein [Bordetella pertussis]
MPRRARWCCATPPKRCSRSRCLRAGLPLGAAHSQAADPGLALNHLLALLIRHGAIISIEE